jgi:hypothetical protein
MITIGQNFPNGRRSATCTDPVHGNTPVIAEPFCHDVSAGDL